MELLAQLHPEHVIQTDLLAELDDDEGTETGTGADQPRARNHIYSHLVDVGDDEEVDEGSAADGNRRSSSSTFAGSGLMTPGSPRGNRFPIKSHYSAEGGSSSYNSPFTDSLDAVERGMMLVMMLDIEILEALRNVATANDEQGERACRMLSAQRPLDLLNGLACE